METRSDVGILKEIYEAERRADRIVREAEAGAKALVAEADAASRSDTTARREDVARMAGEALNAQTIDIQTEISAFLQGRVAETDRWVRERRGEIERIVDRLIAMVVPR